MDTICKFVIVGEGRQAKRHESVAVGGEEAYVIFAIDKFNVGFKSLSACQLV